MANHRFEWAKNKQTNKQVNGSRARHESIQGKPNRVQKGRKMGASGRGSLVKGRRRWRLSICSSLTHLSISSRLHRAGHRRRISLWNVPSPADGQLEPRAATCSFFFTPPAGFFPTFTEFYRVLPNFTEFYRVLPSFAEFRRLLRSPAFCCLYSYQTFNKSNAPLLTTHQTDFFSIFLHFFNIFIFIGPSCNDVFWRKNGGGNPGERRKKKKEKTSQRKMKTSVGT